MLPTPLRRFAGRLLARHYRAALTVSRTLGWLGALADRRSPDLDIVFVVPTDQAGWILEGIAREIAKYFPGKSAFHHSITNLPPAKSYFFVHYALLPRAYKLNPVLWRRRVFVWHTHPRDDLGISQEEMLFGLRQATLVFCACTDHARKLISQGIAAEQVRVIIGGADPDRFKSHRRGGGKVGFCSAYYPRKSPDTILRIVQLMPDKQFVLIGRNWRQYERFGELQALSNFQYVEAGYEDYPALYAQMDVFVSVSKLEGGPIPLIEAMMSNVVPVASRTGFAPDVIRPGENGWIFEVDAPAEDICSMIEAAGRASVDVRATVMDCTWQVFATRVAVAMGFVTPEGET